MSDTKVFVNGAYLPRCIVGGHPADRPHWHVGNMLLTPDALELADRTDRLRIPLATINSVTGITSRQPAPPPAFPQSLLVYHVEGGVQVATALAFPTLTVKNFPMQLSAMLTGMVRGFLPVSAGDGRTTYEEIQLEFASDRFVIYRRSGTSAIPLEKISSVQSSRNKDAQGREFIEWTIQMVEGDSVRPVTFLSYERIPFLWALLKAIEGLRRNASLMSSKLDQVSEQAQQVAVMLYTGGMNAGSIGQMLGIDPDKIDEIYESLLKLGLADVVKVRKEIKLNAAGAKLVDDIMKKQLQAAG